MQPALSEAVLSPLSDLLATRIGLHFPKERWPDLDRGMAAAAREFGQADAQACAHWLLSAPLTHHQIEILASHLTVGETCFFREQRSFEALEQYIFPELLRARQHTKRQLRIWSAGCCTGEEPYSIAMLLDRLIPHPREWNATILATDINPAFLRKAAQGVYGDWSFRGTPAWLQARYFKSKKNARFEIQPHIRKRVTFSYLNLADDVYPTPANNTHAMDVIFCRNVLMYFSAQQARKVIKNLHHSLVDGGWLIVSPTEASSNLFSAFTAVEFHGVVLYQKLAGAAPRVVAAYSPPVLVTPLENLKLPAAIFPEPVVAQVSGAVPTYATVPESGRPAAPPGEALASSQDDVRAAPALMARTCANQGKLAEAIAWCQQAIVADKFNPLYRYFLATILQEQGQGDAAVQSLLRVLYIDPDFTLAHFMLGNLYLSQGRRREAQRCFDNALALLHAHPRDQPLPQSEGLTAAGLAQIITHVQASLARAAVDA